MSIQSFGNDLTEKIFLGVYDKEVSRFPRMTLDIVVRKLDLIESAGTLHDLFSPPGNRLKKLRGDLKEYWSIRVNSQWRILFRWLKDGPSDVQIIDYH